MGGTIRFALDGQFAVSIADHGPMLAMSFVSILPMLIVVAIFQRFFVPEVARTGLS